MNNEDDIRRSLDDTFRLWLGRASLWGCVLFVLLGIAVIGFVPAPISFHVVIALLIYVLYLVPIVLTETVASHRDFLIANTFIMLIFSTMLLVRYLGGNIFRSELGIQDDLERYRGHLATVVQEQTAELVDTVEKLKQKIAERQKAEVERQLLQSQKMESIGRLAGGVVHDINNILTAILSHAELTLMKFTEGHPVRSHLVSIREASDKAATLTHQLLALGRRQGLDSGA